MRSQSDCIQHLQAAGISYDDAVSLRRISMTLHRWHELECGDGNEYASWCITRGNRAKRIFRRDPETQAPRWEGGEFTHADDGDSYLERHLHSENTARYERIPDRERGALKRLATIMARYPGFQSYVQGDPRGCALYIIPPAIIDKHPVNQPVDDYYSRGIAVYK